MYYFVIDSNGKPGHPTRKAAWVSKMLRLRRARLIGGARYGRPPVVVLSGQVFDAARTVRRRFIISLDPGYRHIGFAVSELLRDGTLKVWVWGQLDSRTADIRGLMDERRMYRGNRRYRRREKALRKYGRAKFRVPRWESRGKRPSATVRHAVQTHENLVAKLRQWAPLPEWQTETAVESARFDLRALAYGTPSRGGLYRVSPVGRQGGSPRSAAIGRDGGCVVCGSQSGLHAHHLRTRRRNGSNRVQNLVTLCAECHADVHAGLLDLPITPEVEYRAAAVTNALCGVLRKRQPDWRHVSVKDGVAARRALGLPKTHAADAVAVAVVAAAARDANTGAAFEVTAEQFRRQRRQRIHAQRDRLYTLDGQLVARNRRKRTDQKEDALAEFRAGHPTGVGRLQVRRAIRLYAPDRRTAPAAGGDTWERDGETFVVRGLQGGSRNLYTPNRERRTTPIRQSRRLLRNAGIVVQPHIAALRPRPEDRGYLAAGGF